MRVWPRSVQSKTLIVGFQLIWYQRILLRIIATFKHIKCYLVCRKCVCGKICFLKNTPLWNSCWKTHHHTKNTPSEVCRSFTNNNNWDKTHLPNHLTKSWDWFIHWFWYICISIFLSKKNKRPPKWSLILLFCCLFKHPWMELIFNYKYFSSDLKWWEIPSVTQIICYIYWTIQIFW